MLESQADGSPYLYLKDLTTPYKIRAPFWAPFHDLTSIIPHKTMAGKKKKSRTNQVFMRLSGTLCDCIKYVKPFASDAKEYYFLYQGGSLHKKLQTASFHHDSLQHFCLYTSSSSTSIAASPLRGPILMILV